MKVKKHFQKHWKKYVAGISLVGVLALGHSKRDNRSFVNPTPTVTPVASISATPTTPGCDPTLWNHIYNPQRLHVIEPCKTVTGTVDFVRIEKDGDYHLGLKPDPQFANLVNSCNSTCLNGAERGDLVIEPICENPVSQQDVLDQGVCNGFSQNFQPKVGQHITVTGSYVLDAQHGFLEIHPVSSMEVAP